MSALAFGIFLLAGSANAQTATQDVTVTVASIMDMSVNDATVAITIAAPGIGEEPIATTATSGYDFSSNSADPVKISGALSLAPATGLTLSANLAAPGTGTSAGLVELGTAELPLVNGITPVSSATNVITYSALADDTVAADDYTSTVTYTITTDL